ncbi:MAG: type II secretion system protein GspE [Nitrospiraceae bacterium]|nr:MAG: type II secretion system protein GspE [Nitrospiraceae bacterium]
MKNKIGELLLEAGLITSEQLENALKIQKNKNKRLGKLLIELGYANELQVGEALSKEFSFPLVDCGKYNITEELLSIVPKGTAEKKIVMPLELKDKKLLLAVADPLDWETIDEITFNTGLNIAVAVSTETSIINAIETYYGSTEKIWDVLKEIPTHEGVEIVKEEAKEKDEEINIHSMYKLSEEPPIVKLVTMLFANAATTGTSDIHIEPGEKHVQVRYRLDGSLKTIVRYPKHIHDSVVSRVKIISNLDITNRRLPQDGRSKLRFENRDIDLRVSTMPSFYGENIVIRLLDSATGLIPLGKLGIPEQILKPLIDVFSQPQGMLLVTGPTGSGKTTTLYAVLRQLNEEESHIVTIEEPIEYRLAGITQVGVNEPIGLSFPNVLRSTLRQDPDIIMVGEIRDIETAKIVVRAALTGHLVLSTLHTNDTVATVTRLLDIGLDPYLISSSVSGILAQRLIRRLCPDCKVETAPPADLTKWKLPQIEKFYKGTGCKKCMNTGYKGRIGVYEFLHMNTKLRRLIARRGTADELWDAAREDGMLTLFEDAISKVKDGIATFEEVASHIPYSHADARKEDKGS